jgi:hypothetical protein
MNSQLIVTAFVGCFLVPMTALLAAVWYWSWQRQQHAGPQPIIDKMLRPAGEHQRLKIDQLSEELTFGFLVSVAIPGMALASVALVSSNGMLSSTHSIGGFVICAGLFVLFARNLCRVATELSRRKIGFHGERAVAEEVNQLLRVGCLVFHDLPLETSGYIDHIIVSPAGVFAVETKTRTKRRMVKNASDYEVVYDGECVRFPDRRDTEMLVQARSQAGQLRSFLSTAVGEDIPVMPILALPGWHVSSKVRVNPDDVHVLNPSYIKSLAVNTRDRKLSTQMMQRIAHQLEWRCRTVEL